MSTRRTVLRGLANPSLWIAAVVLTLMAVRIVAAADEPAKAEAERLAAELRRSQDRIAALEAENNKLRAELAEAQRDTTTRARAKAETDAARDEAPRGTAEPRSYEERLNRLIEQVAALRRELAEPAEKKAEPPKPQPRIEPPPADDGPSPERLKRLADEVRRQAEAARDAEEKARREGEQPPKKVDPARPGAGAASDDGPTVEQLKRLTEELRRQEAEARRRAEDAAVQAEQARAQAEQARREAEARAVQARVDPARMEAEVRAARLEAQLQVMQMAYQDLRKETNRLREELDTERKARHEATTARAPAADPATQQRLDNLEAQVKKISVILDNLMKKPESPRPQPMR
jgi:chromosome segregation ATPase